MVEILNNLPALTTLHTFLKKAAEPNATGFITLLHQDLIQHKVIFGTDFLNDLNVGINPFSELPDPNYLVNENFTLFNQVMKNFYLVLIDSGTTDGDAWQYLYYPAKEMGILINEAILLQDVYNAAGNKDLALTPSFK